MSPTTSMGVDRISARARRTTSAKSGRAAPEPPTQVRETSAGVMPAAAHAWQADCRRDSRASTSPTRTMLLGPAVAVASERDSSPTAQVVLVPPPSIPR